MSADFDTIELDAPIHRVGRPPDPWDWVDWNFAGPDGTFTGRWDDRQGRFRVLYGCAQRRGAFVEVLAQFRPDPAVVAALGAIEADEDLAPDGVGAVPASWCHERVITQGIATDALGPFIRVGGSQSLSTLRTALVDRLVHYGVNDLDGSSIRLTVPRPFTQEIASFVEQLRDEAQRAYGGIYFLSKLGDDIENWAIFERQRMNARSPIMSVDREAIDPDDPDFVAALHLLGLHVA